MKIGITCYPTYGGSGTVATELGMALAERGHQIYFITSQSPYRLSFHPNIHFHEVEAFEYPLFEHQPYLLALAVKIAEIAEKEKLDVIHAHYAVPLATSAYLAREMLGGKLKLVTTLHGTDITLVGSHPSYFRITKFSIEKSDAITCVSDYLARETKKELCVNCDIKVIHNFVDTQKFMKNETAPPFCSVAPHGEKIIAHISNFRPVKRTGDVIEIFNLIQKRLPARLLLAGDGPELSGAMEKANLLGISNSITFLGKQPEIEKILACADLLLLPSQTESFGLVALEAMSARVPVIATNVGGIPEVVEHGVCGYLAEVGDVNTMAKYAIEILSSKQKQDLLGSSGREIAERKFSKEKIVMEYENTYRSLLKNR